MKGYNVRTLDELKENFSIDNIVEYYLDGKLLVWLEQRFYKEEADNIKLIGIGEKSSPEEIIESLIKTFSVEVTAEEIKNSVKSFKRIKRISDLQKFLQGGNQRISNFDNVVFSQEEFESLIQNNNSHSVVYLYGDCFELKNVPFDMMIEGINNPILRISGIKELNLYTSKLKFKNIIIEGETGIEITGNKSLFKNHNVTGNFKIKDTFKNLKFTSELKNIPISYYYGNLFNQVYIFKEYIAIVEKEGNFIQILDNKGGFVKNIYYCRYDRRPERKDDLYHLQVTKSKNKLYYTFNTGIFKGPSKRGLYEINMNNLDDVKISCEDAIKSILAVKKINIFDSKLYIQCSGGVLSENLKIVDVNNSEVLKSEYSLFREELCFSNGSTGFFEEENIKVLIKETEFVLKNEDKILNPKDYYYSSLKNTIYFRVNYSPYVYIYNLHEKKLIHKFKPYEGNVSAIYIKEEFLITLSEFGEVKFWNVNNLELIDSFLLNDDKNKNTSVESSINATEDKLAIVFNDVLYIYTK